jgi:hypothetical protein
MTDSPMTDRAAQPERAGPAVPATSTPPEPAVLDGTCFTWFAFDVGLAIDLDEAAQRLREAASRQALKHHHRAPQYFEYQPPPLRIAQPAEIIALGRFATAASAELTIYDFGAVSVQYRIALRGPLADLAPLSESLYDNQALRADARRHVEQLVESIRPCISKPELAPAVEDYTVYQISTIEPACNVGQFVASRAERLAQILRSEHTPLSQQEIDDALGNRISFGPDDLAIIDWNSSLLIDRDYEAVLAVLEFANVELLELRFLDHQLDRLLSEAHTMLARSTWRRMFVMSGARDLRRLGRAQLDSAVLFEEINNALKLLGDQYLARVYRLASDRLHIPEWDASILRKLQTAESIYSKISDYQAVRRMELLEWIIILLIALGTLITFIPGLTH